MTYLSPSEINISGGLPSVLIYLNNVTNQWFANFIMITIYAVVLGGYYKAREDFVGAFAVSGFATFVIGLLFWAGGLINGWVLSISVALLLVAVAVLFLDNQTNA